MSPKCIMVTGGAGFIGSNFLHFAAAHTDSKLVVVDSLTYAGNLKNISALLSSDRVSFVKGDINDPTLIDTLFNDHAIDTVVHFAAESHVDRSILGPEAFIRTNINGTFNLLRAARQAWADNVADKLFLHVSTDEVYGSLTASEPPFDESTPYRPNSPYSASKAASDHLVRAWHHTYGLPCIISNCSNNYGRRQFPEKLIPLVILNALEGKPLPVYGDGLQIRDWLHVEDHCRALLTIIDKGESGQTYCIGGNNERTNLDVVNTVCDILDRQLGNDIGHSRALIKHVTDRPGHDTRYAINASKMRQRLDWEPQFNFETALEEVVAWYLNNMDWVDEIRSGEYTEFYARQYGTAVEQGRINA